MRVSKIAVIILGFAAVCVAITALADDVKIKTEPAARYARDLQIDDTVRLSCDWNTALVTQLVKEATGRVVVSKEEKPSGKTLTISATKLVAPKVAEKRTNLITVRAEVLDDGKLIATRDITRDDSAKAVTPFCDALRALGKDLGDDVAEWLEAVSLPECPGNCPGIHPDDPIMTGPEVLVVHAKSINDTVMQCGWTEYMVKKVVKEFNEDEVQPRAKLQISEPGAPIPSNRKLTLRVDNIHVIGGGGFTGPKWISMSGELKDGELLVGSFEALQRDTAARFTTCGALENLSDNMSEKIAKWLKMPRIGAKL